MTTTITFFGGTPFFFDLAFESDQGLNPVSLSPTQIVLNNPDTGAIVTIFGQNMSVSASGAPSGGTTTAFSVALNGSPVATVSYAPVSLIAFDNAIEANYNGNTTAVQNLLGGALTFDASAATSGATMGFDFYSSLSGPFTIQGSNFTDYLVGSLGNDSIVPRDGADDVIGSNGSDTIDYSQTNLGPSNGDQALIYSPLSGPINVVIDGTANTGTVTKTTGTDTLIDVAQVLDWYTDGFGIIGTNFNDTFRVTGGDESWMQIRPGEGDDLIVITPDTADQTVRVDYSWNGQHTPFNGIVANLATGIVFNDGYGGQDTITVANDIGFRALDLRGTDFADSIIGSDLNERILPRGGNDTLDGGGGDYDVIRYDRSGMDSGIDVDLSTGQATGIWNGTAFTHTLSNFEEVRGTGFNDTMVGGAANENLRGRNGDDSILGGAGDDRLYGNDGNDTLEGGTGRDRIQSGDGNDLIRVGTGAASGESYGDIISPGLGQDTIIGQADHFANDAGIDLLYDELSGIGGMTITADINGSGTAVSGDGRVNDTFSFVDHIEGSNDADHIMVTSSGGAYRGLVGSGGDDTLEGGAGSSDIAEYRWDDYAGDTGIVVNMGVGGSGTVQDGYGGTDTLINIDQVRASNVNDTMNAGGDAVNFRGQDGNDRLNGSALGDQLSGGDGADTIAGGAGDDWISGGDSDADLRDVVYGGDGNDTIEGGAGNDELRGDAGNDDMAGGAGADTVIGGAGDDVMTGSNFGDLIFGGDGFDFVNGGFGNDRVNGGNDADRFFHVGVAGHGSDWIQDYDAAEGDVLLYGGSASIDQFQVNRANTANAGDAAVDEAFVIYKPTGQILWALVDGFGNDAINIRISGVEYDLLG